MSKFVRISAIQIIDLDKFLDFVAFGEDDDDYVILRAYPTIDGDTFLRIATPYKDAGTALNAIAMLMYAADECPRNGAFPGWPSEEELLAWGCRYEHDRQAINAEFKKMRAELLAGGCRYEHDRQAINAEKQRREFGAGFEELGGRIIEV